jgi:hypothetical protein
MSRQQWIVVGVIAVVAVLAGVYLKNKSDNESSNEQSQLPAQEAEANYTVPPDIGMSVDNTGGINFPLGDSGVTYTVGQSQSLPANGNGA